MNKQELTEVKRLDINTMTMKEVIGLLLLGLGAILCIVGIASHWIQQPSETVYLWLAMGFVIMAIVLHELAHGLAFIYYTGKVKFGWKLRTKFGLVAYATSPNSILAKREMIIVALAPQVMTVLIFAMLPFLNHTNNWLPYSLLMFAVMNLGGGCVDLYSAWLLWQQKGEIFAEDTGTSMVIYRRGEV